MNLLLFLAFWGKANISLIDFLLFQDGANNRKLFHLLLCLFLINLLYFYLHQLHNLYKLDVMENVLYQFQHPYY